MPVANGRRTLHGFGDLGRSDMIGAEGAQANGRHHGPRRTIFFEEPLPDRQARLQTELWRSLWLLVRAKLSITEPVTTKAYARPCQVSTSGFFAITWTPSIHLRAAGIMLVEAWRLEAYCKERPRSPLCEE